ncbi:MAG: nucleotidyl transferase AbiEii/AbiGii toxin family protein [Candidatus Gottesmanbacteria bacterium]|nr:nucleotidyl transferase AbiEii/AbiGii toxin family protein [Candidatus Gottesmanbacteria bacterium]
MGNTILTDRQCRALTAVAKNPIVARQFYLTGGTALSEYYLHHRPSEDLDFFSEKEIDLLWLTTLGKTLKSALTASTVDIQQSYNRNLMFFSFSDGILKMEFTYFPFTQIENPLMKNGVKIDSLIDIAVNKFFTIYQQPASRHFIDLYCILQHTQYSWGKLTDLARAKFDVAIDPVQLGSQLITAQTIGQLPHVLVPLDDHAWRRFYLDKAKTLKSVIRV